MLERNNMKHPVILFLFIVFGSLTLPAQTGNNEQELVDLLYGKRIKEAIEYYDKHKDNLLHPFTVDSYKLFTDIYLNKSDSVFLQLPLFMEKYYGSVFDDDLVFFLPSLYFDAGDYVNGLKMVEILESFFLKRNEKIEKMLEELTRLKNSYPISQLEIHNDSKTEDVHIPVKTEPLLLFEAKYNGSPLQTVFDTGSSLPFLTDKKNADKAGIKIKEAYGMNMMNGVERSSANGWIDSIRIGSLLIKNVPVFVFEQELMKEFTPDSILMDKEKKAKADSIFDQMQIIMGMPVIQMLNHIQFNFPKNEMVISLNRKDPENENNNMYVESNYLYLKSTINDIDFSAFFDTGANLGKTAVVLTNQFYQVHKDKFPTLSPDENESLPKLCSEGEVSSSPTLTKPASFILSINGNRMDLHKEAIIIDPDSDSYSIPFSFQKEGFLTLEFMKKFRNVTFDFHNMMFDGDTNE